MRYGFCFLGVLLWRWVGKKIKLVECDIFFLEECIGFEEDRRGVVSLVLGYEEGFLEEVVFG